MPRIAAAVMVVITVGVSIGINIARFPVVSETMSRPRAESPVETFAPTVPEPVEAHQKKVIDLSQMAPPPIYRPSSDLDRPTDALPVSRSEPLVSPSSPTEPSHTTQSSPPGNGPMRLISQPSGGAFSSSTAEPPDWKFGQENEAGSSTQSVTPDAGFPNEGYVPTAPPILFGPPSPGANNAPSDYPSGPTMLEANESTTWPAKVSPIMKLATQPVIDEPTRSSQGGWHEQGELVPIVWPESSKNDAATSLLPSSSASSEKTSSVERLPMVVPGEPAFAEENRPRRPDSPIPVYPTTDR